MLPFDSSRNIFTVWYAVAVCDLVEVALGQIPDRLGVAAMLRVRHQQVGRQAMAERAHFAGRAAGRRLARSSENGPLARLGDLAGEQVDVVNADGSSTCRGCAGSRPWSTATCTFLIRIGDTPRASSSRSSAGHAGELRGVLEGVGLQARGVLLERDGAHRVHLLADLALVVAVLRRSCRCPRCPA